MNDAVIIKPWPKTSSMLIMNRHLMEKLNLTKKKRAYVSFGTQKCFADVRTSREAGDDEIYLSPNVLEYLHLPEYPDFELRVHGNGIAIGPCIGILTSGKGESISKRRLKEMAMNVIDYPAIRGAIILFTLNKVDTANRFIEGYCYNPKTNSWEKGVFPYPLSIYQRIGLDEEWQNHFLSAIGDTVFNNYYFDKWQMYNWFSNDENILPHLPETRLYETSRDVSEMLNKFQKIYVKPIWGMKGYGVISVSSEEDKVVFRYREDGENREITANNHKEFEKTIRSLFKPGSHIIQQGLDLMRYNGGVIDFRCVMQKNESSRWICNGIVARVGAKESVVSNISSGGSAFPAMELFRKGFSLTETEAFALKERMVTLGIKICGALDQIGINCGTLGLDLGLDKHMNLWIIEINNRRPHPAIALRANDLPSYYSILASPLHYAKSLAGFGC